MTTSPTRPTGEQNRPGGATGRRTLTVARDDGTPLWSVAVADRFGSRAVGLLGRAGLALDEGLWIKPCRSVHTAFMRFTIDVVYLDKDGRIVKLCPHLRPFRASSGGKGTATVLELSAGAIDIAKLKVGDLLVVR